MLIKRLIASEIEILAEYEPVLKIAAILSDLIFPVKISKIWSLTITLK